MNPGSLLRRRFAGAALLVAIAVSLPGQQDARARIDALYRQQRFAEAAEALQAYLPAHPRDREARLLLGLCYQLSDEREKAESVFRQVVETWPDDSRSRYFLARILYLRGKLAPALEQAAQARQLGEPPHLIRNLEGLIYTESGVFPQALAAFDEAAQKGPQGFFEADLNAGKLLLRYGRATEAERRLSKVLDARPGHPEALYHRARARLDLRQYAKARQDLEAVLAAGPNPEAAGLLARVEKLRDSPAAVASRTIPEIVFEDATEGSGVKFTLENSPTPQKHLPETMPGGIAVFDYDGDGLADLFFPNGAELPSLTKTGPRYWNRLYRNKGNFRFEDVTEAAGIAGSGFAIGAAAADYDADGDVDLFVAGVHRVELYRNRGDGTFEEVAEAAGLREPGWAITGAWLDADRDGWLDLFVVRYVEWTPAFDKFCGDEPRGFRVYCHPSHFSPTANRLYRNRGDGTFEEISAEAGIAAHAGKGMSAALTDVDGDGDLDIFVPNDTVPNFLFVNEEPGLARERQGGRFREAALEAGVALTENGKPVSGMGAAAGDYDNDGRPDLLMTALPGETFPLFRNSGGGIFREMTYASGLGALTARLGGWGVAMADFNNDGILDVAAAASHVTDNIETFSHERYRQPVKVFAGSSPGVFHDDSARSGPALQPLRAHRGLVAADLDHDGRLDLIVTALGEPARLLRNVSPQAGSYVHLRLEGAGGSRDAVGARVTLNGAVRELVTTAGYASSVHAGLHFGLGAGSGEQTVDIVWPGGASQTAVIAAGRTSTVRQSPRPETVRPAPESP